MKRIHIIVIVITLVIAISNELYSENYKVFEKVHLQQLKESIQSNQVDLGFPEPPEDVYFYPLDVEMAGYAFLDTVLINQWQVPNNLLQNMSDEGLIITCLNLPFLHAKRGIPASNFNPELDIKMEFAFENFNGFQELLKRENVHIKLMKLYVNPECRLAEFNLETYNLSDFYKLRIAILARLLAKEETLKRFTEDEMIEILDRTSSRCWESDNSIYAGYANCLAGRIAYLIDYEPITHFFREEGLTENDIFSLEIYNHLSKLIFIDSLEILYDEIAQGRTK
ncbi:MAG: hypothetical protein Q7J16_00855 [Candidatus Cloacimonadales bacterium]|nr:hypothetical protein [Candidatus Cloacimonadales bacterium]